MDNGLPFFSRGEWIFIRCIIGVLIYLLMIYVGTCIGILIYKKFIEWRDKILTKILDGKNHKLNRGFPKKAETLEGGLDPKKEGKNE